MQKIAISVSCIKYMHITSYKHERCYWIFFIRNCKENSRCLSESTMKLSVSSWHLCQHWDCWLLSCHVTVVVMWLCCREDTSSSLEEPTGFRKVSSTLFTSHHILSVFLLQVEIAAEDSSHWCCHLQILNFAWRFNLIADVRTISNSIHIFYNIFYVILDAISFVQWGCVTWKNA